MHAVSFLAGMVVMWGLMKLYHMWVNGGRKVKEEESKMDRPPSKRP